MSVISVPRRFSTAEVLGPVWRSRGGNRAAVAAPPAVIKIKEIFATFEDVRATPLVDKVIVQGTVVEQILFVDSDNIVREKVVRVPFSQALIIPGATPESAVDVRAEVEFIITEINETGTEVKDKIVIRLEATASEPDPSGRFLADCIIGSGSRQVLLVNIKVFGPQVSKETAVVGGLVEVREQVLVVSKTPLEAVKIKSVDAVIRGLTTQVLPDKVIFQGVVHKVVSYVGFDNVVRALQEEVPFSHVLSVPGVQPEMQIVATARVEFLIPELDRRLMQLKQKIVLIVAVEAGTPPQEITFVTDVVGPGIVTSKVQFYVDGAVFTAVTDVSGPGIVGVTKQTIFVVVVGGPPFPVPVDVVTDVLFSPEVSA